ncbi:MAG: ABC transporter ATP-binding protein [Desulfurococcales archaeon]|nr:ABC transporter ATP-binding protein [Desulfurococcales archaeon]
MTETALIVENLWKSYDQVTALKGVSFEIGKGEIFGLIGPNGAGKTTTLRIIAGILHPDKGVIRIYGKDPKRDEVEVKRIISYLPEDAGVYRFLKGIEFLRFLAEIYAETSEEAEKMVEYGSRISGLGERLWDPMKSYSKGMKRRLLLASTLMTRPKLAILDEPTSGLDVYHSVLMRKAIKNYVKETGASVLLSSHNMLEVEYLCDRVAFIDKGQIIAIGTPEELKQQFNASNLEEAFINAVGGEVEEHVA